MMNYQKELEKIAAGEAANPQQPYRSLIPLNPRGAIKARHTTKRVFVIGVDAKGQFRHGLRAARCGQIMVLYGTSGGSVRREKTVLGMGSACPT